MIQREMWAWFSSDTMSQRLEFNTFSVNTQSTNLSCDFICGATNEVAVAFDVHSLSAHQNTCIICSDD